MLAASVIVANADLQSLESRRFGSHSRTAHASSQQPGHTNERSDTGHTAMMHEMLPGPRPPTCCMLVAQQDALHNFVGVGEGEGAHEHDPPPSPALYPRWSFWRGLRRGNARDLQLLHVQIYRVGEIKIKIKIRRARHLPQTRRHHINRRTA